MLRNLALLIFTLIASVQQQNPSGRSNAARYRIVHSVIIDGKEEFISVAVRPGISTSELTAIATELHRLHPKSNLDFSSIVLNNSDSVMPRAFEILCRLLRLTFASPLSSVP